VAASARIRVSGLTPFARAVLDAVDLIPRGKVMAYGDVAEYLGQGSARGVGMVMARWGHEVAWHRVVMADGRPAPGHEREQLARLRADDTPLHGQRVDMSRARWDGFCQTPDG
jgi:alkylated DNA nucleotide flippase Atl1